jgi:hypothetical protein
MNNDLYQRIMQELDLDYSPQIIEILVLINELSDDDIKIIIGECFSIFDPNLRVTIN